MTNASNSQVRTPPPHPHPSAHLDYSHDSAGSTKDRDELRRRRKAGLPASATGLPWLIVAPASVVRVWMDHLKLWGHFASFQLESGKDVDVRRPRLRKGGPGGGGAYSFRA